MCLVAVPQWSGDVFTEDPTFVSDEDLLRAERVAQSGWCCPVLFFISLLGNEFELQLASLF